jgi:hypothetical protein
MHMRGRRSCGGGRDDSMSYTNSVNVFTLTKYFLTMKQIDTRLFGLVYRSNLIMVPCLFNVL